MASMNKSYFETFDDRQGWNETIVFSFWNEYDRGDQEDLKYAEVVFLTLFIASSFAINILYIGLYIGRKELHTVTNMFIVNVCVSSLMLLPIIQMIAITRVQPEWGYGDIGCKITILFIMVAASTTVWVMALISIDRYRRICSPGGHQLTMRESAALALVAAWLLPAGSYMYVVLDSVQSLDVTLSSGESAMICTLITKYTPGVRLILIMFGAVFTVHYLLPIVIMSVCYTKILLKLKRSAEALKQHQMPVVHRAGNVRSNARKKKAVVILIAMLASTILMWIPAFLALGFNTMDAILKTYSMRSQYFIVIMVSVSANTIINPTLYSLTTSSVRTTLLAILRRNVVSNSPCDEGDGATVLKVSATTST